MKKKGFRKRRVKDPGYGGFDSQKIERIINDDGTLNVKHINRKASFRDLYHDLINVSWSRFFLFTFLGYLIINLGFAGIYYLIGVESIGLNSQSFFYDFVQCFYFSTQTFTTVGYGSLSPQGGMTSLVASIEAFVGLLAFSFATGLFYGRFSRPVPSIFYSDKILLRPLKKGRAIMFRIANEHTNTLINVNTNIILVLKTINDDGSHGVTPYQTTLERNSISFLSLTWTIVINIDEDSPLFDKTDEEIKNTEGEFIVHMSYFDDTFSQDLHQQKSYLLKDLVINEKFVKAYGANNNGQNVLDYEKLNLTEKIDE